MWHLVNECNAAELQQWRAETRRTADELLKRLANDLMEGYRLPLSPAATPAVEMAQWMLPAPELHCDKAELTARLAAATADTQPDTDWAHPRAATLVYTMMCMLPWTSRSRACTPGRAHTLARVKDVCDLPAHSVRPYANHWATWAYDSHKRLAAAIVMAGHVNGIAGSSAFEVCWAMWQYHRTDTPVNDKPPVGD
jgi:hypothetical protein